MAHLVSELLETLSSILLHERNQKVRFVVGVQKEVDNITLQLRAIKLELADAERRKWKEHGVEIWLDKLVEICYDLDDVLDEWSTEILKSENLVVADPLSNPKVCCSCLPCGQAGLRPDIASRIKDLNGRVNEITEEKTSSDFHFKKSIEEHAVASLVDERLYGTDDYKKRVVESLLSSSSEEESGPDVVSIIGMGGVGKTTLAQLVYNDELIEAHFDERIWVWVGDDFNQFRIGNTMSETLNLFQSDIVELEGLVQRISLSVQGKKFLLVLDDVWIENPETWRSSYLYKSINCGLPGSKILVTTRTERVAEIMGSLAVCLQPITAEESWSVLLYYAFSGNAGREDEGLINISREIVRKCGGLPLTLRTLGSLLRFKYSREEWEYVLVAWDHRDIGILGALRLCYQDLPSRLRCCFSYCALFPKNYVFEKDELISLWMAQGYLRATQSKGMNMIGREYFQTLAARSFFQNFLTDEAGSIIMCQMHDLVHDSVQFLARLECINVDEDNSGLESQVAGGRLRHLMMKCSGDVPLAELTKRKKLRSLLVESKGHMQQTVEAATLSDLFTRLTSLRALKLRNILATEITADIGKLIHLRHLDLSDNKDLSQLPEKICELYNLLTLDLRGCRKLQNLPHGLCRLINLIYLKNYQTEQLFFIPRGIERLTSLMTLDEFVVNGGHQNVNASTLGDLKDLNQLQKFLKIRGLGNLTDVEEARKAQLMKKKHLTSLILNFDFQGKKAATQDHEVVKVLEPPPGLKHLEVNFYRGNTFSPNWMMKLDKLSKVCLSNFMNLNHLPPLGKLPSLKYLEISRMEGVQKVGYEFLGLESDDMKKKDERQASSSSSIIAFPKLEKLIFSSMDAWEEWDARITPRVTVMPCLSHLCVRSCSKLEALPTQLLSMNSLKELAIDSCHVLKARYYWEAGKDWDKISHIPFVKFDDDVPRVNRKGKEKMHASPSGAKNQQQN